MPPPASGNQLWNRVRLWTPHFIYSRIRLALYERRHPEHPWLNCHAVTALDCFLGPEQCGIEFGSGRSTKWIAKRVALITSVESNARWYEIVSKELTDQKLDNVEYLFQGNEEHYLDPLEEIEDESLDFVIVDGAFDRGVCALKAVPKVRSGGLLVVDNASWFIPSRSPSPLALSLNEPPSTPEWEMFLTYVNDWGCLWTHNGLPYKDTAFFFRSPICPNFESEIAMHLNRQCWWVRKDSNHVKAEPVAH